MGLDMYAMITTQAHPAAVDFRTEKVQELHYWRKHPNLHGWMCDLYYSKGGSAEIFNLVPVALTLEDLDRLQEDIRNGSLPPTCVFHGRWASIPRHRGQPFHASGSLTDLCMESFSTHRVKRFQFARALPHALACEGQPVGVMDEAVQDGIGQGRIADGLVPVLHRELAGDNRGAAAVAVFEDFQQVASFG